MAYRSLVLLIVMLVASHPGWATQNGMPLSSGAMTTVMAATAPAAVSLLPRRGETPLVPPAETMATATLATRLERLETLVKGKSREIIVRREDSVWNLRFGGKCFIDFVVPYSADATLASRFGPFRRLARFRKSRLTMNGSAKPDLDFKFEINFADGDADLTESFVRLAGPGDTKLTLGRRKEPFILETDVLFMEPSPAIFTLCPKDNIGLTVAAGPASKVPGLTLGIYRQGDGTGVKSDGGGHAFSAQWGCQPRDRENGRDLWHLGGAYSHRLYGRNAPEFSYRPAGAGLRSLGRTGPLPARYSDIVGARVVRIAGPFGLASEWNRTRLRLDRGGVAEFDGGYLAGFWFLTGEHQTFDRGKGMLGNVAPRRPYAGGRGGAWMLGLRFDFIDLDDAAAGVRGGLMREWTAGLNWHLTRDVRWMTNLMQARRSDHGTMRIAQMRIQVDF